MTRPLPGFFVGARRGDQGPCYPKTRPSPRSVSSTPVGSEKSAAS